MLAINKSTDVKPNLLVASTTVFGINTLLIPHILKLSQNHEITIIAGRDGNDLDPTISHKVNLIEISIGRKPNIIKDPFMLVKFIFFVASLKPLMTVSVTPKAGLFVAIAARLCKVPKRVHLFTGQVWHTKKGASRFLFKLFDKLHLQLLTIRLADSKSQIDFLEQQNVAQVGQVQLLGNGSARGIDTNRYKICVQTKERFRKQLGTRPDVLVVLFLSRIVVDKGIHDAALAVIEANKKLSNIEFWLAGPDEENLGEKIKQKMQRSGVSVRFFGMVEDTVPYFQAADLLILPSKREGFGLVIVEAAACATPAIAYDTYGVIDAIEHNKSGILVPYENRELLISALTSLLSDTSKLDKMAEIAAERSRRLFGEMASVDAFIHAIGGASR